MRPSLPVTILMAVALLIMTAVHPAWLGDSWQWAGALWRGESSGFRPAEVEGNLARSIHTARSTARVRSLQPDVELHDWLKDRMKKDGIPDLDSLTRDLQLTHPRYINVAAYAMQGPSTGGLLEQLGGWPDKSDASFTHEAIVARPRPALMGFECVVVVGTQLPEFSPEALGQGGDKFFSVCPLCGKGQPCQIPMRTRSFSLDCPHCHRSYALLAADTHQRFHYVNEYLTGYEPSAHFQKNLSRLDEMLTIWKAVIEGIRYVPDTADGNQDNDAWQTARETQMLGTGDCEDSSIYLADWLIARGFEARVCVGRCAERGGHAWVIVRLNAKCYLLESTNPHAFTEVPPLADEVGSRYVPEASFDRQAFYLRNNPDVSWDGDYWTESRWQKIVPPNKKVSDGSSSPR